MAREKKIDTENVENVEETKVAAQAFDEADYLTEEMKKDIEERIKTLKAEKHIKRIFAIVVQGDEEDEKPYYIGYFQNPTIMHFSQYMSFVTKDAVAAALNLAKGTFVDGDRELIDDDDIFLRGTFDRFSSIMERRNSELVKV